MKRILCVRSAAIAVFLIFGTGANSQPLLNIQAGVKINWPTATNDTYRPQWSPIPPGAWTDLSGLLPGDGTPNSFFDPVLVGARSYPVLEMVPGSLGTSSSPSNSGFEFGNGTTASNWVVTQAAGGPVYA